MKKLILISMMILSSSVAMAAPLEFNKFSGSKLTTCKADETSKQPGLTLDFYGGGDLEGMFFGGGKGEPAFLVIISTVQDDGSIGSLAFAATKEATADKSDVYVMRAFGAKLEFKESSGKATATLSHFDGADVEVLTCLSL